MDAGLMMAMRDVHKSRNDAGVLRAFLSDSSPQGTQNWQLSEYWETGYPLEVSDYVDEMADLMDIALLPEDEREEEFPGMSNEKIMDRHKHLTQECHGLFSWHMLPPTALGFRSQGYFHKLNAVLHSLYNESHSFHDLRAFLRTVCSITTDLGVEKGLGDASNMDLTILLQQFVDLQYIHLLDVFALPELEEALTLCAYGNRTCSQGFAAFTGASRRAAEMEYVEAEPRVFPQSDGIRRVFHRVARIKPLMKCRVWIADFDEDFSDLENYSEDEDEFFPLDTLTSTPGGGATCNRVRWACPDCQLHAATCPCGSALDAFLPWLRLGTQLFSVLHLSAKQASMTSFGTTRLLCNQTKSDWRGMRHYAGTRCAIQGVGLLSASFPCRSSDTERRPWDGRNHPSI